LWWFNNKETHHVENKSELSRISIIFDVKNSKWRG